MELLKLDGEIDQLMARGATARELLKAALAKGFRTLADDGARRVLEGATTLDEAMRVVDMTDRG
jgi:general secretion pathway protein E/type IV pilus assembly protein PilB